jgi:pimeloyl-ACP methyl ester carboxylesterase
MQVTSRGFRIHFQVHGAGAPVLLLHEFGGSGRSWLPYLRDFSKRYALVAVDALGHGRSDRPQEPHAYETRGRVSDFVAVLDALGIDRAHVWGYSMGGRNAWAILAHAPERVASLAVGGAGPPLPGDDDGPDYLEARAGALSRGDWRGFWRVLTPDGAEEGPGVRVFRERFERNNDPAALAAVSLALREWPELSPMARIPPSCHYAGALDGFLRRVQAGAAVLGGAMHVIEGVGHEAHFKADRAVAAIVRTHLDRVGLQP